MVISSAHLIEMELPDTVVRDSVAIQNGEVLMTLP